MKLLIMLLAVVSTTTTNATELKPYIGTGGQFQLMILYSSGLFHDPRDYHNIYPSLEPYIEAGCETGKWEFYGTYEFNEPRGDEWSYSTEIDSIDLTSQSSTSKLWWTNERYCLGVRYRGYDDPVRPLIGIGVELSQFVQTFRQSYYRHYYELEEVEWDSVTYQYYNLVNTQLRFEERDRLESVRNVGGVFEIGVGLSPISQLEVICMTRIHGAVVKLGHDWLGNDLWDDWVTSPAFLVQLRYAPFTFKL